MGRKWKLLEMKNLSAGDDKEEKSCSLQWIPMTSVSAFERSWFDVIFSYIWYQQPRAKWKYESCWTMKRNNQPHNSEDVFLCCLKLFSSSPKRQNSFKISIIYHQMKFVVYVQVYLYTPRSMANKSLEVQKMPRGSAIATVRPFFLKILFNSTFLNFLTLYWTSIN